MILSAAERSCSPARDDGSSSPAVGPSVRSRATALGPSVRSRRPPCRIAASPRRRPPRRRLAATMPLASPASDDSRGGEGDRRAGGRRPICLFDRDRHPSVRSRPPSLACSPRSPPARLTASPLLAQPPYRPPLDYRIRTSRLQVVTAREVPHGSQSPPFCARKASPIRACARVMLARPRAERLRSGRAGRLRLARGSRCFRRFTGRARGT